MQSGNKRELNLKLGNLLLAIVLATVPTVITYGVLGFHGIQICNKLETTEKYEQPASIKAKCIETSWETTESYIVLIGFFITLPTWLWFYWSVKKKNR